MTRRALTAEYLVLMAFLSLHYQASAADCNSNGVDDAVETAVGASPDCNHNSVPDACEFQQVNEGLIAWQRSLGKPELIRVLDLDGKGALDLAYFEKPFHSLAVQRDFLLMASPALVDLGEDNVPEDVAGGDLDGDGDGDLAVLIVNGDRVAVLLNRGDGSFGDVASPPPPTVAVPGNPASLAVADLDGNGRADLALPDPQSGSMALLLSRGGGEFSEPLTVRGLTSSRWAVAGDMDGDGDHDLVVTSEVGAMLMFLDGPPPPAPYPVCGSAGGVLLPCPQGSTVCD